MSQELADLASALKKALKVESHTEIEETIRQTLSEAQGSRQQEFLCTWCGAHTVTDTPIVKSFCMTECNACKKPMMVYFGIIRTVRSQKKSYDTNAVIRCFDLNGIERAINLSCQWFVPEPLFEFKSKDRFLLALPIDENASKECVMSYTNLSVRISKRMRLASDPDPIIKGIMGL